jgi:hypothetical protein
MLSKNTTRYFKTLSMAEKVRLMAWSEEGISTTAIVGRHHTSLKFLLTESRGLPYYTIS